MKIEMGQDTLVQIEITKVIVSDNISKSNDREIYFKKN